MAVLIELCGRKLTELSDEDVQKIATEPHSIVLLSVTSLLTFTP